MRLVVRHTGADLPSIIEPVFVRKVEIAALVGGAVSPIIENCAERRGGNPFLARAVQPLQRETPPTYPSDPIVELVVIGGHRPSVVHRRAVELGIKKILAPAVVNRPGKHYFHVFELLPNAPTPLEGAEAARAHRRFKPIQVMAVLRQDVNNRKKCVAAV